MFLVSPQATEVLQSITAEAGQNPEDLPKLLSADTNLISCHKDQMTDLSGLSFHVNTTWSVYNSRERVLDTLRAVDRKGDKEYLLELMLNSYASKILFDKPKRD
jgi:choline dehydrogenase